ncbi:N-acetyltransferase family protein [Streptosporangium sp. NPDC003464]
MTCSETTVVRRGVGAALLGALIASTETAGIWTIQSGIFPENTARTGERPPDWD